MASQCWAKRRWRRSWRADRCWPSLDACKATRVAAGVSRLRPATPSLLRVGLGRSLSAHGSLDQPAGAARRRRRRPHSDCRARTATGSRADDACSAPGSSGRISSISGQRREGRPAHREQRLLHAAALCASRRRRASCLPDPRMATVPVGDIRSVSPLRGHNGREDAIGRFR